MEEDKEKISKSSLEKLMFKAVCSECGAECEVPFQPTKGKSVKCNDCFKKVKSKRFNNRFLKRRNFRNSRHRIMHKAVCSECGAECEVPFIPKEGKPVKCNNCFKKAK
ncbi:MAG: CxxC-x17-CxxC domain-containing protein [Candidatus Pacearchaeota archaeon]